MAVHQLTRADARRVAMRAQLLDHPRPTDLMSVVRHLTILQYDQTAAVAPSADLVLWSRLGPSYAPEELAGPVKEQSLIQLGGMIRPAEDTALFRGGMGGGGAGVVPGRRARVAGRGGDQGVGAGGGGLGRPHRRVPPPHPRAAVRRES